MYFLKIFTSIGFNYINLFRTMKKKNKKKLQKSQKIIVLGKLGIADNYPQTI